MNDHKNIRFSNEFSRLEQALSADKLSPRFQSELERLWRKPVSLSEFTVPRVFPVRDGSFAIQYRMKVRDNDKKSSSMLILGGHLLAETDFVPKYISKNSEDSFFLEDILLAVPLFPFDPELENLRSAYESPQDLTVFKKCTSAVHSAPLSATDNWKSELLAYRMGKRCVFGVSSNSQNDKSAGVSKIKFILKLFRPKKVKRAIKALSFLAQNGFTTPSADCITVPSLLSADESAGIILTSMAPGRSLHDMTGESKFCDACASAAHTLTKLHNLPGDGLPKYLSDDQLSELGRKVIQAGTVFPEFSLRFHRAWTAIDTGRSVFSEPFEETCIHTDFYDKQLFVGDESITLLDTDSLSSGDPALDIGNFMAHLYLRSLQAPNQRANIEKGLRTFREAFAFRSGQDQARIRYWEAATFLRLAVLYSFRPKWHKLTGTLLTRVVEYLPSDSSNQTVGKRG